MDVLGLFLNVQNLKKNLFFQSPYCVKVKIVNERKTKQTKKQTQITYKSRIVIANVYL